MTKLLISVRDVREAQCAASSGADIIDLKEPLLGSLGRASTQVLCEICESSIDTPISVAMGELFEAKPTSPFPAEVASRLAYAKVGCARTPSVEEWKSRWRDWREGIPGSLSLIAVAYADYRVARSPAPLDVARAASELGAHGVLLDTFSKSTQDLTGYLSNEMLRELVTTSREHALEIAFAGSLSLRRVPQLLPLRPDIIAVRGAACDGGRLGKVCGTRVRHLANLVHRRRESMNPMSLRSDNSLAS